MMYHIPSNIINLIKSMDNTPNKYNVLIDELKKYSYINITSKFNILNLSLLSRDRSENHIQSNYNQKNFFFPYSTLLLDENTLSIIACTYINKNEINEINEMDTYDIINVYKYNYDSTMILLFYIHNSWYILSQNNILKINNYFDLNASIITKMFQSCGELDKNYSYNIVIHNNKYPKILWQSHNSDPLVPIYNQYLPELEYETQYNKDYSQIQEDIFLADTQFMTNKKEMSFYGYSVLYFSKIHNDYKYITCETQLSTYLKKYMPSNRNKYINYLELYQKNLLNEIIVYVHKYPNDVLRRIHESLRTLSKEIVNIYHLTRRQQNQSLYECLPHEYKKILYDLHKIYVDSKQNKFIYENQIQNQDDNNEKILQNSHVDDLKENISISVDVVSGYLKFINIDKLVKLFFERSSLIENIKLNNLHYNIILDNIEMTTQIKLMSL